MTSPIVDKTRVSEIRAHAVRRRRECRAQLGGEALARCWDALARAALDLDPAAGGRRPR